MAALSKEELRREASAAVASLGHERILALSSRVERLLFGLEDFRNARVVASYVAKRDEVQTESILRRELSGGVKVLVPLTSSREGRLVFSELRDFSELAPGGFGILEPRPECIRPSPLTSAQVVLVPLVAWDERGYRIGHGKGYFDKALAPLARSASVGLAFEAQRVERVPDRSYDVPLGTIVTERRVLRFGRPGPGSV